MIRVERDADGLWIVIVQDEGATTVGPFTDEQGCSLAHALLTEVQDKLDSEAASHNLSRKGLVQ